MDFDTNKPVADALVTIQGSQINTVTNILGYFKLKMDTSNVLIIEKDGYDSGILKVPSMQGFQIKLKKFSMEGMELVETQYAKGRIKDGIKIGIWQYFDTPGELALKINYSTGNLMYVKPDTSQYTLQMDNKWIATKVDICPRPIESAINYYKSIASKIRYPLDARRNSTVGKFHVYFEIDTLGQATNFKVFNEIGDGCGIAVINALKLNAINWIVANKNGGYYKSAFLLPVNFRIKVDGREIYDSRKKKNLEPLPQAHHLDEMELIAKKMIRSMTVTH